MTIRKLLCVLTCAVAGTGSVRAAPQNYYHLAWPNPLFVEPEIMVGRSTLEHLLPASTAVTPARNTSAPDVQTSTPPTRDLNLAIATATEPVLTPSIIKPKPPDLCSPSTRPGTVDSATPPGYFTSNAPSYFNQPLLSGVGDVVDFEAAPLPSFDADILYLFVPARLVQPFWSVARQIENPRDDGARLGFGTGLRWNLTPRASLSTQTLFFPAERAASDLDRNSPATPATSLTDVQFVARLEIKF